jgi:MFS family permease
MFLLSRWSGGLVARLGAKRPLIVGPLVAALGFLLFARPSVGGNYWTTFFPGFLVLGFGMAMSVAPLTTVVMDTADQNLAGTASGINNAVARVAGLLAVAVLGMVMVNAFSRHLNGSITALGLPTDIARVVRSNELQLAALSVPAGLDTVTSAKLASSIDQAFVFGFRFIMMICAALSLVSSAFAWRMIGIGTNPPKSQQVRRSELIAGPSC